ncbi:MAG TPA: hypothetical protein VNO21_26300 [Polyangiaceae bacterium]|nr:hypothetical protein [Polyangiaceae bacterium]
MPTSHHAQVSKILDAIVHTNPKSVLDIGTGFGKYGVLCREYLELWDGREDYQKFTRRIDGIEIFPQYLTPIHKYVYDEVFVGDALDIVPNKLQRDYDLALLIDVLEHLKKEDGAKLLGALLKRAKNVIISVPRDIGDQGTVFGNEHETHHAEWTPEELFSLRPGLRLPDRTSYIVFLGEPEILHKLRPVISPSPARATKRFLVELSDPARGWFDSLKRKRGASAMR